MDPFLEVYKKQWNSSIGIHFWKFLQEGTPPTVGLASSSPNVGMLTRFHSVCIPGLIEKVIKSLVLRYRYVNKFHWFPNTVYDPQKKEVKLVRLCVETDPRGFDIENKYLDET